MNGKNSGSDIIHNEDRPTFQDWDAFRTAIAQGIPATLGNAAYHLAPIAATHIQSIKLLKEHIVVRLSDGRELRVPWSWFPILYDANEAERESWILDKSQTVIEFPLLATEISLDYLLRLPNPDDPVAFAVVCTPPDARIAVAAALLWHEARRCNLTIEDMIKVLDSALQNRPPV